MNMNEKQFDVREKYMVECIENVTKLVGVPTEESCLKAIEFLEEMGKNKYSDLALTNNMKKSIVILYMSLLNKKAMEYLSKKQFSEGVELLERIMKLILHHSKDLGIDKQIMISFLNEFINDIQLSGLVKIDSKAHMNLKENAYKKARQIFGDKVESQVFKILIDCILMSEFIRQTHKIE